MDISLALIAATVHLLIIASSCFQPPLSALTKITSTPSLAQHSFTVESSSRMEATIPLVDLSVLNGTNEFWTGKSWQSNVDIQKLAQQVVGALETSGFLLVQTSEIPMSMQEQVIQRTTLLLGGNELSASTGLVATDHPTDPKRYIMWNGPRDVQAFSGSSANQEDEIFQEYWRLLENVKRQLLTLMGLVLSPEDPLVLLRWHSENQSAMRLLFYPGKKDSKEKDKVFDESIPSKELVRCKAHSDYGSLTLLLTDGVPGLQASVKPPQSAKDEAKWIDVPHVPGCLVVNVGSLLSDMTQGRLLATLHRVLSTESGAMADRTSIAFFCDPNPNVNISELHISSKQKDCVQQKESQDMTAAEYIEWRSGGSTTASDRSGMAFTKQEQDRLDGTSGS